MIERLKRAWKWLLAIGVSFGVALLALVAQRRRLDPTKAQAKAEEQRRTAAEIMARGQKTAEQAKAQRESDARVAEIERRTVEALSNPEPTTDDANALLARLKKGPPS